MPEITSFQAFFRYRQPATGQQAKISGFGRALEELRALPGTYEVCIGYLQLIIGTNQSKVYS